MTPVQEIRIIHLTLSVAKKTPHVGFQRKRRCIFPQLLYTSAFPKAERRLPQAWAPWCLKRLSGPSLTEGCPVCIISPRNQTHGFLCKENCCKIPTPLVSSTHSQPSTPPCHWRVLAGQRHRQLLIAKVSTARAESRFQQEIQNCLVQLRCP